MLLGLSDQTPSTAELSPSLPSLGYVLPSQRRYSLKVAITTRQQERHSPASDTYRWTVAVPRLFLGRLVTLGAETSLCWPSLSPEINWDLT